MSSIVSPSARAGLWSAGLVALVVGGSFLAGCLEPLVAVAVIAAGALPLGRALLLTAAVWLAGQAVGFGLHDYPRDAQTMSWGVGLGLAALAATLAAAPALRAFAGQPVWLRGGAAFVAAFVANQVAILGVEQVVTGACEVRPGVISLVGLVNGVWLAVLLLIDAAVRRAGPKLPAFGRAA
ncbi:MULTISPECIES: hypothetical protein [unclassified Phenylobacterium]|uniref:hypothetical protein n=1 Tax=unclassified Phenylobacterium TaxID=2640670 RepID=UPI00083B2BAD|nr:MULTISPECIES: hypothetical protein [unclassified Phenylobacterium]